MSKTIAAPATTPLPEISATVDRLRATFNSQTTKPVEWRKRQLRKLWWGFKDHEEDIIAALHQDLRKARLETLQSEVVWVRNDIIDSLGKIDEWVKDEKLDVDLLGWMSFPVRRSEPMGVVMIIGAFNYPFQLIFGPLIGAISAGNCAVIKPSEICGASATVMTKIITECLDPDAFAVINGAIPETTKLLEQKFDKICYTGNGMVGRIVATAAAKHLTPVILELGGLNPVIVTDTADAKLSARRICWGKALNGGQVCLSPDYAIVTSSKEAEFVDAMGKNWEKFYPNGMQASPDLSRIVNERHYKRIKKMLDDSEGEIKFGGKTDDAEKYIDLTLVKVKDENDALLKDEIFGPLLPYVVIDDLNDQIDFVNRVSDTPLALYVFSGDKAEQEKILRGTRSGGATVNDTIMHAGSAMLPFGGVGESGTGSYRSKFGFEAFSHHRTIAKQAGSWFEAVIDPRYPPYTNGKERQYRTIFEKSPNFTRDGQARSSAASWLGWMLSLGGGDSKTVALKYVATILGVVYLRNQMENRRRLA